MYLQDIIEELKKHDPATVVREGFHNPHSYRGYYEQLAFEPVENVTIGSMLEAAESAVGSAYTGYKGGVFFMDEYTDCHLANYGDTGEEIGPRLLHLMLAYVAE